MNGLRGVAAPLTKFLIFAVITALCTALLAGTIANNIGGGTATYYARFTDATSVNKGDEIRIAGVRVGQVDSIDLVDRKIAQIKFSIRDTIPLPSTTQAFLRYRNLIGQRYIALEQGTGAPQRLAEGGTIPVTQTHPAVNLTQLFNGFRPLLQALSPTDVNQLSMELVQVLQGEGGTVSSLLARTASLTNTVADKDKVIGEVIDNLNQVLDTVNDRDKEFTQLIITVRKLVSGLSQDRKTIGDAVDSIGDLTDATADLLHDARPPLREDIKQVGRLAENLNDNRNLVERFLVTLPRKLDVLTPLGTNESAFNFYLCNASATVSSGPINLPIIPGLLPGGLMLPGIPPTSLPLPANAQPRCSAAGLPNNFGIHNDDQPDQPLSPLVSLPSLGGGG